MVPREHGLRILAGRAARFSPVAQIQHALERPDADRGAAAVRALVDGIESLSDHGAAEQAAAFWRLVEGAIARIGARDHSKRRAALHAAFLLGEERQANLGRRLERAREAGRFGEPNLVGRDRPRQWWTDGVIDLALTVDRTMSELLADPSGWSRYLAEPADVKITEEVHGRESAAAPAMLPTPPDAQPVFVEQHVATYFMHGHAVHHSTNERRVRAMQHGVEGYIVRTYDPVRAPNPVTVRPLLNCSAGPLRSLPDGRGGQIHERSMFFPLPLLYGERTTFASEVVHDGADPALMVEIQVTSQGIAADGLTMRVQFQEEFHPVAAWWFADVIDARRLDKPPPDSDRRLSVTRCGYLEHRFRDACRPLAKYGLAWEW